MEHARLENVLNFMKTHDFGVHTICSHQFTSTNVNLENELNDVQVFKVFVLSMLCISKQIRSFDTHTWMAHVAQHATYVPAFMQNGQVLFGTNNHISVEA